MSTAGTSNAGPSSYAHGDPRTKSLRNRTVLIDGASQTHPVAQGDLSSNGGVNVQDISGQDPSVDTDEVILEDDEVEPDSDPFIETPVVQRLAQPSRLKPTPFVNITAKNRNNTAIKARMLSLLLFASFIGPFCELTKHPNTCSIVQVCHVAPRKWSWSAVLLVYVKSIHSFPELIRFL